MIALALPDVKEIMTKLLLTDAFDSFLFVEGSIQTFSTFSIDGYLNKDFFEENVPTREYALWKDVREHCFAVIKGNRTPLQFRFVLALSEENTEKLIASQGLPYQVQDVRGLYLNLKYESGKLQCVTGTAMKQFTMDKSIDQVWDAMVQKFFAQKNINYELL